jgi:chemosensory pili system protein ChpB (putative protein-glutamate methylesterase)
MRTETAQRVVVLGREGPARDQLVGALGDLGVAPVWVGRPGQNNPDSLLLLNPNKIVVSLEPAIELELEPYSEILGQPGISVVYDDAESSKGLNGWDLNRWARHFAAKLLGRSLMPPAPGRQSGAIAAHTENQPAATADFSEIPVADGFAVGSEAPAPPQWQEDSHYEELEIDQAELQKALEQLNRNLSDGYSADADLELSFDRLTPLSDDENSLMSDSGNALPPIPVEAVTEAEWNGHESPADAGERSDVTVIQSDDDELRSFLAETAATVAQPSMTEHALELAPEDMAFETAVQPQQVAAPEFDLSKYTLVDHDKEAEEAAAGDGGAKPSLAESEPRVRDGGKSGLFLVISGVGSPGALRSLLEQIPADFQGVVALSHQIDPTQIPAFRGQLQKVSKLPLEAIEDNEYVKNGHVYLLPPNCTLFKTPLGYQCIRGGLDKFIDQIDHNAEILILSGADASLSQALIQVSTVSHNIHVQNPDDCYESGLVRQLVNIGAPVLDRNIIDQWFN